ncbi:MAG: Smr/MutS family protein [Tannerella sp.]|jgi:DNA mismatch repair protein MutS2|nr:Smr/MutS family protein [Tannerella sp.]
MIYPQTFEKKTGFDVVRRLLTERCISSLGKERVDDITFMTDFESVTEKLEQTAEFTAILRSGEAFPADFFIDARPSLRRIRPEGMFMDEHELFDLKRSLQTIIDTVNFFRSALDDNNARSAKYPRLQALAADVPTFPNIVAQINAILDKYGYIRDNASHELLRIRKDKTATAGAISRNLQSILRSAQSEGIVAQDVTPTMRDGRLVIPVSPAFKRRIKGIVHDESATGKTVFIEPETVVEANNRIRELEAEEKREIVRILTSVTDAVRPFTDDIIVSFDFLADIDFIRAKALLACELNAIKPFLVDAPLLDWQDAVHPLLKLSFAKQSRQVVPLDMELIDNKRILIISGPNAGGKSVCLKTVGLLQYMLQCGLPVPVGERSRCGLFQKILLDIGDEQSIENDLSTYSSHLAAMKFFARNTDNNTLFLIDEFGSGTEPLIGGALAEALLDRFNSNGALGVITTHYQNLKLYADEHDGALNGAMLYDRNLMQPLFKLSVGRPGSSFAIDIARKTGLPEDVIAAATAKVGSDYVNMDKFLQDIIRDKRYWEQKRQQIRQQEKRLEELEMRYNADIETINNQRKELLKAAKSEADKLLSSANAQIENTIRQIKEAQAEKEQTRAARRNLEEFKADINKVAQTLHTVKSNKKSAPSLTTPRNVDKVEIVVGTFVRIKGQSAIGEVLEISAQQAIIAFGNIKTTVKPDKLEPAPQQEHQSTARKSSFISSQTTDSIRTRKLNFKHEIDVRGMRGNDALQAVTFFIDDTILAGVSPVRILHGTGEGILRQLIRQYLATVPEIRSCHDEDVRLGGAGITVVEIISFKEQT